MIISTSRLFLRLPWQVLNFHLHAHTEYPVKRSVLSGHVLSSLKINRYAYFISEDKIKKPDLNDEDFDRENPTPRDTYEKATKEVSERSRRAAEEKEIKHNPYIAWAGLIFLSCGCGVATYLIKDVVEQKIQGINNDTAISVGLADIGGPFRLTDMNGKNVTEDDFKGSWSLLYFGFTHCPDVCPDTLDKITKVMNALEKKDTGSMLNVLFISVDPSRDTVPAIKDYLKDFHSSIIGLTGSDENVKEICKNFRIYYSAGPKDPDQDYIVDHTTFCFLMNPKWKYAYHYGPDMDAKRIFSSILGHITSYNSNTERNESENA